MSKKTYPLDIDSVGGDEYIVMSRGHHDIHDFMKAVRETGYEYPLGVPEHRWAKVVPDATGEYSHIFAFVKEGTRGAIPVTYAWEAYGEDAYEAKYPMEVSGDRHTCAGCENLERAGSGMFWCIDCKETGSVVPHSLNYTTGEVVFWRVPMECPLPNGVVKSEEQAPESLWVKGRADDIKWKAV